MRPSGPDSKEMDEREVSPVSATSAIASCRGWKRKLISHRVMRIRQTLGTPVPNLRNASLGTNHGLSCWDRRLRHSRITTPTNHTACRISGDYSNRLGTRRDASGSSFPPYNPGGNAGMRARLRSYWSILLTPTGCWATRRKEYDKLKKHQRFLNVSVIR